RTLLADHPDFVAVGEGADRRDAVEAIAREKPDLVFLDVQMAEMNGLDVARALEARAGASGPSPAVIFVTAYDRYALSAFEVHALDYLLKPFDEERFAGALDRVRAHHATSETRDAHTRLLAVLRDLSRGDTVEETRSRGTTLRVADLEVDIRARRVTRAGAPVALRPKEFELLVALLKRAGDVITRRELLHEVWGYGDDVISRTIDTHVAELRRKLGHAAGVPGHIATVARTGYRLEI
ncbi:MAG: response regulator transcription factor, partial [Gemmatimonadaceae bacterium]